jgi:hypothetical protein
MASSPGPAPPPMAAPTWRCPGARRGGLPGRARGCRGVCLRRATTSPAARLKAAPGPLPPPGLPALQALRRAGGDGHQRQDQHRLVAGAGPESASMSTALVGPVRWWALWAWGLALALVSTGMTTRPGAAAARVSASLSMQGLCRLRHRGLLHWTGRAPAGRHAHSHVPCSPTSPRTTWTTTAAWPAYWQAKRALFDWPGSAVPRSSTWTTPRRAAALPPAGVAGPVERLMPTAGAPARHDIPG